MILFQNQTADGFSTEYEQDPPNHTHTSYTLIVGGELGGATVKVQTSADNVSWTDVPNVSVTEATTVNFVLNTIYLRVEISGAGGSTNVTVAIQSTDKVFFFNDTNTALAMLDLINSQKTTLELFEERVDGAVTRNLLENILTELKKCSFYLGYAVDFELDDEDV